METKRYGLRHPYFSIKTQTDHSFGGSQTWSSSRIMRKYGCGVVGMADVLLYMGLHLLRSKKKPDEIPSVCGRIKTFLSSFLVGTTNPAAVLTFLFAFSYFGISGDTNLIQGVCLVIGVFLGTYLWWTALSVIVSILKGRQKKDHLQIMNRIFGVILCLFGMVVFIRIII